METSTELCVRIGFLCLIAALDGMVDSCLGPALRDLQCIFNVTLQRVSLFQPVITAGRVIGALVFLKIPSIVNTYGVAAAAMAMASCLLAVVPVLPSFWMALGLSGAVGLAHGMSVHARILLCGELSKQSAATIHIINVATSAGSVTGPLIIAPFLSDSVAESTTGSAFHHGNVTFIAQHITDPAFHHGNVTFIAQNRTEPDFGGNMTLISQNITAQLRDNICYRFHSDLMYGFLVVALLGMAVFAAYLLTQRIFQDDTHVNQPKEKLVSAISVADGIFLIIFIMYTIICGPMIFVYGQYLPTFGMYCNLHADTSQMANISLSLYVCVMFGRLFGTFCSLAVAQTVLIDVCTAVGIMVSATLIYVSELDTTWLWIGTSILAGVSSPVISALNTWALEVNRHRRILYGISSIGDMAGYSVMSLLTGQLMAYISVQMLNYVMTSALLLQMALIMLLYLTVCVGKPVNSLNEDYMNIE